MKKLSIIGTVGKDPIIKKNKNNGSYIMISIAVNYKDNGEQKTDWIDVYFNEKMADNILKYVFKGSKLYVEGSPVLSCYNNKNNEHIIQIKIFASQYYFFSNKHEKAPVTIHPETPIDINDDSIPF